MRRHAKTLLTVALIAMLLCTTPAMAGNFGDFLGRFFLGSGPDEANLAGQALSPEASSGGSSGSGDNCQDRLTFAVTEKVYPGISIDSVAAGDAICREAFGEGWEWAEWHDDPDGNWYLEGSLASTGYGQEPWVSIDDKNAECFSTGNSYGLTLAVTRKSDGCMRAACHGREDAPIEGYDYLELNSGSLISCNPYTGDTPCDEWRPLLCAQKDIPSCEDALTAVTCEWEGCTWDDTSRTCFDEVDTEYFCTQTEGLLAYGEAPEGPFELSDHFSDPISLTYSESDSSSEVVFSGGKRYHVEIIGANTDPDLRNVVLRVTSDDSTSTKSLHRGDVRSMTGLVVFVESIIFTSDSAVAVIRTGQGTYPVNLRPLYECEGKVVWKYFCEGYYDDYDSEPVKMCESGCENGACTAGAPPATTEYEPYCREIDGHLEEGYVPPGTSLDDYRPFLPLLLEMGRPQNISDEFSIEVLGGTEDSAIIRVRGEGSSDIRSFSEGEHRLMAGLEVYVEEVIITQSNQGEESMQVSIFYMPKQNYSFKLGPMWSCDAELGGEYETYECSMGEIEGVYSEDCDLLCGSGGCYEPERYCTVMQNHVERGVFRPYVQRDPVTAFRSMNIGLAETFEVEVQGQEYEVTLLGGSVEPETIILRVSGPNAAVTKSLNVGDSRLMDGLRVYIDDIIYQNVNGESLSAEVFYAFDERELRERYYDEYDMPPFEMQPLRECKGGDVVMRGCDGDEISSRVLEICANGCSDGACLPRTNKTNVCTDSDGDDPFTRGFLSLGGEALEEERFHVRDADYDDYVPTDLVVRQDGTAIFTVGDDAVSVSEGGEYVLGDMQIILTGVFYDASDYDESYIEYDIIGAYDFCDGEEGLTELFCEGETYDSRYVSCEHGCSNGACEESANLLPVRTMFGQPFPNVDNGVISQQGVRVIFRNDLISAIEVPYSGGSLHADGYECDLSALRAFVYRDGDRISLDDPYEYEYVIPDERFELFWQCDWDPVPPVGELLRVNLSFDALDTYDEDRYAHSGYVQAYVVRGDAGSGSGHGPVHNASNGMVPLPPTPPPSVAACDGCRNGDSCLPYGLRLDGEYCSWDGEFAQLKEDEAYCQNDFECSTNLCLDDRCVSRGFFDRIWDLLSGWF